MKTIENVLFLMVFLISFIGLTGLIPTVVTLVLIAGVFIYLFAGWYLLLPDNKAVVSRLIPFAVSYLIAQTIMTILFGIRDWPLKEFMAYITVVMTLLAVILLAINRKRIRITYPVDSFLIRLVVCSMFAGSPLWMQ